ncbi:MAG: hypothetical protein QOE35_39 [Actinomycetota bacterium]|jgi:hypothetical protein
MPSRDSPPLGERRRLGTGVRDLRSARHLPSLGRRPRRRGRAPRPNGSGAGPAETRARHPVGGSRRRRPPARPTAGGRAGPRLPQPVAAGRDAGVVRHRRGGGPHPCWSGLGPRPRPALPRFARPPRRDPLGGVQRCRGGHGPVAGGGHQCRRGLRPRRRRPGASARVAAAAAATPSATAARHTGGGSARSGVDAHHHDHNNHDDHPAPTRDSSSRPPPRAADRSRHGAPGRAVRARVGRDGRCRTPRSVHGAGMADPSGAKALTEAGLAIVKPARPCSGPCASPTPSR